MIRLYKIWPNYTARRRKMSSYIWLGLDFLHTFLAFVIRLKCPIFLVYTSICTALQRLLQTITAGLLARADDIRIRKWENVYIKYARDLHRFASPIGWWWCGRRLWPREAHRLKYTQPRFGETVCTFKYLQRFVKLGGFLYFEKLIVTQYMLIIVLFA